MSLQRASWMVTVALLTIGGLILLIYGYQGYAAIAGAIAIAAAINL